MLIFARLTPLIASQRPAFLTEVDESGYKIRREAMPAAFVHPAAVKPKKPMKLLCAQTVLKTKPSLFVQQVKLVYEDPSKNKGVAACVAQSNVAQHDVKARKEDGSLKDVVEFAYRMKKGCVYNRPENTVDRTTEAQMLLANMSQSNDSIRSVLWSNDGKKFVAQFESKLLKVFDLKDSKFRAESVQGGITDLGCDRSTVLSPDGTKFVSIVEVSREGYSLYFWGITNRIDSMFEKKGFTASWSNNSKLCAMPARDFGIEVFDAETGNAVWISGEKRNEGGFVWSQDDCFIYTYDNKFLEDIDKPSEVYQYDVSNGKLVSTWQVKDGRKVKDIKVIKGVISILG
jgi:WD40 repeat protein